MYLKNKELRCFFLKNLNKHPSRESEASDIGKCKRIDTARILFHFAEFNLRDVSVLEPPRTLFRAASRRAGLLFSRRCRPCPKTPELVSHENMGDIQYTSVLERNLLKTGEKKGEKKKKNIYI